MWKNWRKNKECPPSSVKNFVAKDPDVKSPCAPTVMATWTDGSNVFLLSSHSAQTPSLILCPERLPTASSVLVSECASKKKNEIIIINKSEGMCARGKESRGSVHVDSVEDPLGELLELGGRRLRFLL